MRKSSKRQRGPVTEDIPEAPEEAIDEKFNADICVDKEPIELLEPEEIGIQIFIFAPKHSKSFRKLAAVQFKDGKVAKAGTVLLPDGQIIMAGATVKTEMLPELKVMLRDGVFLAGKAPRRS